MGHRSKWIFPGWITSIITVTWAGEVLLTRSLQTLAVQASLLRWFDWYCTYLVIIPSLCLCLQIFQRVFTVLDHVSARVCVIWWTKSCFTLKIQNCNTLKTRGKVPAVASIQPSSLHLSLSLSGRQGVHAHSPSFPSCSQEWIQMVWESSSHWSSQTILLCADFHKTCWKINQVEISAFKWVHSKREKRLWWLHCLMSFTIKIFEWMFK